jgi:hypothetical protein
VSLRRFTEDSLLSNGGRDVNYNFDVYISITTVNETTDTNESIWDKYHNRYIQMVPCESIDYYEFTKEGDG